MSLHLLPATPSSLAQLLSIRHNAFLHTPLSLARFPHGESSSNRARNVEAATKELSDPTIQWMQVVEVVEEGQNERPIAFAKWHIYLQSLGEADEVAVRKAKNSNWGKGANVEACKAFLRLVKEGRRRHMGNRPHLVLGTLATDPEHQGRGAGRMLVEWGTKLADEHRLECYLEASEVSYKLYRRMGFEDMETLHMDFADYGGEGAAEYVYMIRPARESHGSSACSGAVTTFGASKIEA